MLGIRIGPLFQLPPGIVKMKKEEFVMGDALTEYVNLTKIIYAHEVVVILDEEDKIKEKVRGSPNSSNSLWEQF